MNAVTCLNWVKKGAAKSRPDHVKLTEEEMTGLVKDMKKTALNENSDSEDDVEEEELPRKRKLQSAKKGESSNKPAVASSSKNMKKRDEQEDDSDSEKDEDDDDETNPLNLAGVMYYANPSDDPYLSKEPDSDDDIEILANDNLVALGKVNKDDCNLEVYVYNEQEGNCWCHHDYILPTIPLCLEWVDFDPGSETRGNFVAIGSMAPDIELWDLDVLESLEPAFVLAGDVGKSSKKKKKKRKSVVKGHSDAVLDLSWNKNQRQALASASADFTLGLWDLEQGEMVTSFPHEEKVQSIQWHPTDPYCLLSGCADSSVTVFDCRELEPESVQWKVSGEVENVIWHTTNSNCFLASTDSGCVYYFDKRVSGKSVFDFKAHEESVTGMALADDIKGCFVTCSSDKTIKMWDINDHAHTKEVFSRDINIGQLFCVSLCPDASLICAVGGERELKVLNLKKNASVIEHFKLGDGSGDKASADNVDIPVEGGMDTVLDEEDEILASSSAENVVVKKKTHRGKKHKKNAKENVATGEGDKVKGEVTSHDQDTGKNDTDNIGTGEGAESKKKKKKKKKKSLKEAHD